MTFSPTLLGTIPDISPIALPLFPPHKLLLAYQTYFLWQIVRIAKFIYPFVHSLKFEFCNSLDVVMLRPFPSVGNPLPVKYTLKLGGIFNA
jgi:hypothetical protein